MTEDGTVSPNVTPASPQMCSPNTLSNRIQKARPSRLDHCDPQSALSQSNFRGIGHMTFTAGGFWLICNPLMNKYEKGYFFSPTLLHDSFGPIHHLLLWWLFVIVWSYSIFTVFLARHKKKLVQSRAVYYIAVTSVITVPLVSLWTLFTWAPLAVFPRCFALTVWIIHGMKMHSFAMSMREAEKDSDTLDTFTKKSTWKHFTRFIFAPCVVYEVEFIPSIHPFRVGYFIHKLWDLACVLMGIFLVSSSFIIPVVGEAHKYSPVYVLTKLVLPLVIMDILFFFMMFECILNLLAEVTNYGDRDFYEDWWNCTNWDEFARKWNRPVHMYLLKHVYTRLYDISKQKLIASCLTFTISGILHEFFLSAMLGMVRPWLFVFMMLQIPLVVIGRSLKGTTFGNFYFWSGLVSGVPILVSLYGRDWAAKSEIQFSPDITL